MQRRALAPHVRQPHRQVAGADARRARPRPPGPSQRRTRSRNSPPALLGPPIERLARRRVRDRPEPGHLGPVVDDPPGDERRAAEHEHVAGARRPRPRAARRRRRSCRRRPARPAAGQPVEHPAGGLDAAARCRAARPASTPAAAARAASQPDEVEQRVGGHRRGRSRWRRARTGRGWRRPGPARTRPRPGACGRLPGEEGQQLAAVAGLGRVVAGALAAVVAVEQPGPGGRAVGARPRRATAPWPTRSTAATVAARPRPGRARRATSARQAWSTSCSKAPRLGVRTSCGTRARARTVPVAVDGHRLDRRGADVDPDRDARLLRPRNLRTCVSLGTPRTSAPGSAMRALVFGATPEPWTPPPDADRLAAQPGQHTGGAARHRRRPPAAPRLVRHPPAAHRHLRVGLQADPARLRRGRQRQRDERAVLVPAGDGARGGRRGRRARARGRGVRRRPARRPQPVAVVRAARHRPALPGLRGRRPQPVLELHRRATSAPGIHTGVSSDATGGYAELMPAHSTMLFAVPDAIDDEHAVFADPFAVSLHSITRHPPPAGRPGARVGRRRARSRARSRSCGPCTPTSRWRWSPASTRRPTLAQRLGAHHVVRLGVAAGDGRGAGGVVRRRAPADDGGPRRPADVPPRRHRRRLRHGRQARDASRSRSACSKARGTLVKSGVHAPGPLGVEPAVLQGDQLGRLQRVRHRGGRRRAQARHRALPRPGRRRSHRPHRPAHPHVRPVGLAATRSSPSPTRSTAARSRSPSTPPR